MLQIYFNVFCLYILPIIIGLTFGIVARKKKTYIITGIMLVICGIWWCIMPNIHTHGSELPGLILWMYSFLTLAFSVVELIKLIKVHLKMRVIVLLILVLVAIAVIWYVSPSRFLNNVTAEDVKFIHIFNGNNGSNYTVGDREQISEIVDNIKSISFKKSGISLGRKGYLYSLTFENTDGKIIDKFIINSNDTLRNDPFFYRDESKSLCAEYIGNILLADFHGVDLSEEQSFLATVREETTSYMIVEPCDGEYERVIADKIKIDYGTDHIDYLYGTGRKVVIYYNGGIETKDTATIKTDDISVDGFREWKLKVLPSENAEKKLVLSKAPEYDVDWYRQYNLYYYGLDGVGIEIDGKNIGLDTAINQGMITMSAIVAKANQDVADGIIAELVYRDGGSQVYNYPDYTIVKYHTLDGNDDMYIGSPDIGIDVKDK